MKLLKSSFLLGLILFSVLSFAQNINTKLYAKYDSSYLKKLQKENPEKLDYLNFYAEHASYITDLPDKKTPNLIALKKIDRTTGKVIESSITFNDIENLNFLEYNCKSLPTKSSFYRIGGTDKMLVVKSEKNIRRYYNNTKKSEAFQKKH